VESRRFERYVAIGDSSTEGLDDPDGNGGYRGWANRLAERLAEAQGSVLYANLGVRGKTTRQILEEQLAPAVAMRPDLATVFSGTNDVTSRRFDLAAVALDVERLQTTLIAAGATVLTFTLPDLTPVMPLARGLAPRVRTLNDAIRAAASRTGAALLDFATYPVATDPRLWSDDRLHANAAGHDRIAAALAHAIGLPGTDATWQLPLPQAPPSTAAARFSAELRWCRRHLLPWLWANLHGRSSSEPQGAKRPSLSELLADVSPSADGARAAERRP
jgi:lysophospholipase L1-like esterase